MKLSAEFRRFWPMVKAPQTALLLVTGIAGFMSGRCPVMSWLTLLSLFGSLFLAVSGSTVLNMWFDRDIDARMKRTCSRPLPSGKVSPREGFVIGLLLAAAGVGWALAIDPLYGLIVFAGLFFDVVIYTMWLKRRTAWSIIWGGIAGCMPILAGRALGQGQIEWIGIMLAIAVLFWIPTHMLTFSMRNYDDYQRAGIPTFPSTYGFQVTRVTIAISSVLAAVAISIAAFGIGLDTGFLRLITVLSAGLLLLALISAFRPSESVNFGLFKYASVYMLSAMLLLVFGAM